MTEDIERYWREKPNLFDGYYARPRRLLGLGVGRFLSERVDRVGRLFSVRVGDLALDIGCGSGVYTRLLQEKGARVIGLDFSAAMLEKAARAQLPGKRGGLWFALADAAALPIEDKAAGFLVSVGLLDYVTPTPDVLKEFRRVVRPGGDIVFTIPKVPSPFGFLRHGPGLWVRRVFMGLPPIRVAMRRSTLVTLLRDLDLELDSLETMTQTMWIVRCRRPVSG